MANVRVGIGLGAGGHTLVELVDTSVWVRKARPAIKTWFVSAMDSGEIAMCDPVALEILHSARNGAEFRQVEEALLAMPWVHVEAGDWSRARSVYRVLADKAGGYQRSVQLNDLLIAAAAERTGLVLTHYDSDYEKIAGVTGQPMHWVAPRGSL